MMGGHERFYSGRDPGDRVHEVVDDQIKVGDMSTEDFVLAILEQRAVAFAGWDVPTKRPVLTALRMKRNAVGARYLEVRVSDADNNLIVMLEIPSQEEEGA